MIDSQKPFRFVHCCASAKCQNADTPWHTKSGLSNVQQKYYSYFVGTCKQELTSLLLPDGVEAAVIGLPGS